MDRDPAERIEEEVRGWFSAGIELEPETVHFIESTFGTLSYEALAELLAGESGGQEVLVDLLFSPDDALCCRIEGHLAPEGLSPGQRSRLAERLHRNPLVTKILTGQIPIQVPLPGDLVAGFLDRLCLDRSLDAAVAAAVSDHCTGADSLRVRFRLRQAGLSGTPVQKEALAGLMSARRPDEAAFWPLLEALIGFLKAAPGRDLFTALADRKQTCLRHLRLAADRSRTLERHNIETILIGGDRMPHVDAGALAAEIGRIDDLALILFGRPVPAQAEGLPLDLGEVTSREDLDRLMRFLTQS